jgi:hypothetical protein
MAPASGRVHGKEQQMRRLLILVTLLVLSGCQNVAGPFSARSPQRVDDPSLTISEQQSRGRARYALPDKSSQVGPLSGWTQPQAQ